MANYTRTNDFSVKDGLSTGNPSKLIKGSEIDDEFDAIVTMSTTKANKAVPSAAGNIATLSVTGDLQDSGDSFFASGTRMLFQQETAPTGWTIDTTLNDAGLRLVDGSTQTFETTASPGGSVAFSTVFGRTATDGHTLTWDQSGHRSHTHTYTPNVATIGPAGGGFIAGYGHGGSNTTSGSSLGNANAINPHSHNIDLQLTFADVIVATKD